MQSEDQMCECVIAWGSGSKNGGSLPFPVNSIDVVLQNNVKSVN